MNNKTMSRLRAHLAARTPVLLWGPPGTAKSAIVASLAEQAGAELVTLVGSRIDPRDLGGVYYPDPRTGELAWRAPGWALRLQTAALAGQPAWLFVDELTTAPPDARAGLLTLVHGGRVGELVIEGLTVIGASNRAEHAADGGWLDPATANRWAHIEWVPQVGPWSSWVLAQPWSEHARSVAREAVSFLHAHRSALLAPPENDETDAWPSPRSWTMSIRSAGELLAQDAGADIVNVLDDLVGASTAADFATWRAALDLPDAAKVLAGKAKVPTRGDQAMVCLLSVVDLALEVGQVERAWEVLSSVRPDVALTPATRLLDATGEVPDSAVELGRRVMGQESAL